MAFAEDKRPLIAGGTVTPFGDGFDMAPATESPFELYGPVQSPLPDSVVNHRADKYNYALGETSPGVDQIAFDIKNGTESTSREQQVSIRKIEDEKFKLDLVREYIAGAGSSASQEGIDLIMSSTADELRDPETFYEKLYARKFFSTATTMDYEPTDVDGVIVDNSILSGAKQEDLNSAVGILDASERIKANQELDLKILEDTEARWEAAGWGSTISNYAEMITPFFSWYNLTNLSEGSQGFLLGNNLETTYEYLNTLPVDERHAEVSRIASQIEAENPLDAIQFLRGLLSYTNSDKFLNNAVSALDLTLPLPGVGVIPARAYTGALGRLQNLSKAVIKASGQRVTNPEVVAQATGNVPQAALMQTIKDLRERAVETVGPQGGKSLTNMLNKVKSISDPGAVVTDLGKASQEFADRLVDTMAANAQVLFKSTFQEVVRSGRLGEISEKAASQEVKDLLNISYGRGSDVVIDVQPVSPDDAWHGANYVRALIGNKDATLFDDAETALEVNKNFYGFKGAKVKAIGGKFGLEVHIPVNETATTVRDALVMETTKATPQSLFTMISEFGWGGLRSSKDVVSKDLAAEMDSAIMGGARLAQIAKQIYAPIGKLSKDEKNALRKLADYQRDFKNKDGVRGKFSQTLGELDADYLTVAKRLPSDKEREAYFAAVQLNDLGWVITNAGLFRDKSRKGLELYSFGRSGRKPSIEGKRVRPDDLWAIERNAGLIVMDETDPTLFRFAYKNWLGAADPEDLNAISRTELNELLESGQYKVVQISRTGERAFKEMFKDADNLPKGRIHFIIAKDVRSSPLEFEQIPYRPGGHVELDDGHFISQANISRDSRKNKPTNTTYYGDKNLYHFVSKKEGEQVLKNLEHARQLLQKALQTDKANRGIYITQLRQYLKGKAGLPHTFKEFVGMFKGKDAKFDVNEPFYLRKKNESIEKTHKLSQDTARNPNWIDAKEDPYDLYRGGVNLEWAGERGDHIYSIVNSGDTTAPVYNYKPARHIDALATTERAIVSGMRSVVLDDFKHKTAERWVAEFGDVIKTSIDDQRINPFKAIVDGDFISSADPQLARKISAARASRRAVLEFLSNKTELGRHVDVIKANLWQKIIGDKGELATRNMLNRLDGWSFGAIKDPLQTMRSIAFHQKLGLFNPVQLFLQSQTVVHVMGVAGPVNGFKGFEAAMAQRWAMVAPQHQDYIAKKLLGWKPEEFKESFEWAQRTGWYRVGKEVGVLSDYLDETMAEGMFGRVLEAGKVFFNEGERITRMTAWNASYLEWKAANPNKALDGAAAQRILSRANTLSVDMIASSNASWQRGAIGVPTQFFAYQIRLAEQFLGKRLTAQEKARAFATYSVVYGIPVAMGIPTALWPIHETVKEWALSNGYDPEGPLRFLDEGLMSVIVESLAGEEYNVSERYGPGGLPFLEDMINGDTTMLEALGGVSGTSIVDTLKTSSPFLYSLWSVMNPNSEIYPVTTQDFIDVLRTSNTGNQFYNLLTAINVGKFYSKSGNVTDDMGVFNGLMNAFFGLTPARVSDAYRILENERERKEFQQKGVKEVTKELRKALDPDLSVEDRMAHQRRVHILMHGVYDLDHRQRKQVMKDALGGKTTVYSITREAARNSKPYLDYFERQQRLRERN